MSKISEEKLSKMMQEVYLHAAGDLPNEKLDGKKLTQREVGIFLFALSSGMRAMIGHLQDSKVISITR